MAYKVINRFIDSKNKNVEYKVGDDYPKGNYKPSKERIEELSHKHPKYGRAFIEVVKEDDKTPSKE